MSQVVGEDMKTGIGFIGLEPGQVYQMGAETVERHCEKIWKRWPVE